MLSNSPLDWWYILVDDDGDEEDQLGPARSGKVGDDVDNVIDDNNVHVVINDDETDVSELNGSRCG